MATILNIDSNNANGVKVLNAINQIREGLGTLVELNGLRANAIGVGTSEMEGTFGVDTGEGQALSDRWGALIAAFQDAGNTEYQKLRDFIDAVTYS